MKKTELSSCINWRNKKHRYFVVLLFKVNWITMFRGKRIADIGALNYWLETKSTYKKPLILLRNNQLTQSIKEFEKEIVREKFIKELKTFRNTY